MEGQSLNEIGELRQKVEGPMLMRRNRMVYGFLLVVVIIAGLLSRSRFAVQFPSFLSAYAGDTLWALALYITLGLLFPSLRTTAVALLTMAISFSVELSQLYQSEWINAIRSTRIGALALGAGFKWSDLLCYTAGCLTGVIGEILASVNCRHTRSG